MEKPTEDQQVRALHYELFKVTEMLQGDAWISDDPSTESLAEFFQFIAAHLSANMEATKAIKAFLRKHSKIRRAAATLAKAKS